MVTRIVDLPVASDGRRRKRQTSPIGARYDRMGRRTFVQGLVAVGTAAGFGAIGLFPSVRKAQAENPPWTVHTVYCGGVNYSPGVCDDPCYGLTYRDNFLCATCAEAQSFSNNVFQWHFQGSRVVGSTVYNYRDYPGDICPNAPYADAWVWDVSDCSGTCAPNRRVRCHDGQKKESTTTDWSGSVCEGWVKCNGVAYNPC